MNLKSDKGHAVGLCATVVALACASFFSRSAVAAELPGEQLTRTVDYSDLDLTQAADVVSLYARVHGAAEQVCIPLESEDLGRKLLWRSCVTESMKRAVAKVGVPALTSYYNARAGHGAHHFVAANR